MKRARCRARRSEEGLAPVAARRWSRGAALHGGNRLWLSYHGGHRRRGPSRAPQGKREKVRWGPRKARRGAASGSPSGRMVAVSQGKSGREARALASEADGPILGRTGEVAACSNAGEKERGKRGNGTWPTPFSGSSEVRQRGKKGWGVWQRGTTWCSSTVGPGPDSWAASRPRPDRPRPGCGARGRRALFEQGRGALGHWRMGPGQQQEWEGGERRVGAWADPGKETEWAEPR
jgi:hypothetical protein